MHHRSVSSSSSTSSYAGRPSRFRAEAEAQYAKAGACANLAQAPKRLSEDQIVCQSKLYDAFELQELEQQLDRKLNFLNDHKSRSFSSLITDPESPNYLISVSNDRPSPDDQLQEHAGCACDFCTTQMSSPINDSALPKCKQSLITASNILMQPDYLQEQAGSSCNQPANKHDQLHDEKSVSYAPRSYTMPRSYYHGVEYGGDHSQAEPAKPAFLDYAAQEAWQDQRSISSTGKDLKVQKQNRGKSSRWSLVNSLFRSLKAMHKKQDHMHVLLQDAASTNSTSTSSLAKQQQNNEYHHHHNIVHYHHVHHHHHHHVVNGIHFEEIDWPLSPARLQELGWLVSKNCTKVEDF